MLNNILGRLLTILLVLFAAGCLFGSIPAVSPEYLHRTIYLDPSMSESEKLLAANAIHSWQCSTGNMITANIVWNATAKQIASFHSDETILIIRNGYISDPSVMEQDEQLEAKHIYAYAFFHHNARKVPEIVMVSQRIHENHIYYAIVEHEYGHSIGLNHSPNTNAVMYYSIDDGATHLTTVDLEQFCSLYNCNYETLKVCE